MIKFKATGWKERDLAARLHAVVDGDDRYSPEVRCQVGSTGWTPKIDEGGLPEHPRAWQLDRGNNWWLNPRPEEGPDMYDLNFRYWKKDEEEALAKVLGWVLRLNVLETPT